MLFALPLLCSMLYYSNIVLVIFQSDVFVLLILYLVPGSQPPLGRSPVPGSLRASEANKLCEPISGDSGEAVPAPWDAFLFGEADLDRCGLFCTTDG